MLHHPQQGIHRTGQVGDAAIRKLGAVVRDLAEPEHFIQPGVAIGGRHLLERRAKRRWLVRSGFELRAGELVVFIPDHCGEAGRLEFLSMAASERSTT